MMKKEEVIKILEDKKAKDIECIKVDEERAFVDYLIIATGTSNVHIKALANEIEKTFKEKNIYSNKVEGNSNWILIDYGEIVINLFTEEERSYYKLEDLWKKTAENK